MNLDLFNYKLPEKLIATKPASPRDHSRLLVFDRKSQEIKLQKFFNITQYLQAGDLMIFNNTKVFPARIFGQKTETGGKIEILLLKNLMSKLWQVLIGGKHLKPGLKLRFKQGLEAEVIKPLEGKTWQVKFNFSGKQFNEIINKIGETPIPPYISSRLNCPISNLKSKYQTIYAQKTGSVAAPTAGLHFTKNLLNKIKNKGVDIEFITLHVGMGTFEPVSVNTIEKHQMHAEYVELKKSVIRKIRQAKQEGRRIIVVGTTSARTLEALAEEILNSKQIKDIKKEVNIFIFPGYKFNLVDAMITNFHLPKSTLLMLVSALIGREKTLELYNLAIKKNYRFYSFGDAMFLK
ncbi:tRNA preQ1(34) S-adenosylmethionine ribosyltransferase-isomerase QueA [Candidatus Falkowbacteria bacterium RIFOXYD2_FULL_35_9]|uniref:S-adenosylmethionine:tRNA ribosyltransferase-isomerase n=1 Tax=Candidatus Falkowbacteria bacterium RIFOXYC2_FULL_36_12 TaxID=1798002 RepID=A0A1F5T0D2_9BACT|nr:MAG: tRNA preQ1(34) S-adenosylmethionine ribosyltransferase-isomerase QueA [Candidatus Falkowbacteria bacterium RIFOXYC2_FULL_36_12]OGF34018.1 MAG: tRNA preQ1(34) S-adenosylmethionine ribosyltransferase-isomerase QueA [Candidatus Falkowbacteria bacterium RIFOXYA2_FULL_35_8]OGF47385.1 MAG: tRNA preQ1(34) S-adenosylmethionine ribosyltransferase-isomerase QueA [Candidatus Falkowbacteria bacterium RIFOXYD2_FULL_35_9]